MGHPRVCWPETQRAHDAIITSLWRQNGVMTSFDVIITSSLRRVSARKRQTGVRPKILHEILGPGAAGWWIRHPAYGENGWWTHCGIVTPYDVIAWSKYALVIACYLSAQKPPNHYLTIGRLENNFTEKILNILTHKIGLNISNVLHFLRDNTSYMSSAISRPDVTMSRTRHTWFEPIADYWEIPKHCVVRFCLLQDNAIATLVRPMQCTATLYCFDISPLITLDREIHRERSCRSRTNWKSSYTVVFRGLLCRIIIWYQGPLQKRLWALKSKSSYNVV